MAADVVWPVIYSVILATYLIFGTYVIWDLQNRKSDHGPDDGPINLALKCLFYGMILIGFLMSCVAAFRAHNIIIHAEPILWGTMILLSLLSYMLVYMTLVWRIQIVFQGTIYALTSRWKLVFAFLFILDIFLSIPIIYINFTLDAEEHVLPRMTTFICYTALPFSFGASGLLAMYIYEANLLKLVKAQAASVSFGSVGKKIELKEQQTTIIAVASKAIWLFFLACCSGGVLLSREKQWLLADPVPFWVFLLADQFINTLCIYLQFAFRMNTYNKCCKYPDLMCRKLITCRIKRYQTRFPKFRTPGNSPKTPTCTFNAPQTPMSLDIVASPTSPSSTGLSRVDDMNFGISAVSVTVEETAKT